MVTWVGIENVTPKLPPIWLSREKNETATWKPLRKVDCERLNKSKGKPVKIEKYRATADPEARIVRQNFAGPDKELTSATWFLKDFDSESQPVLVPIEESHATRVEGLYKRAIHEASLMGNGLERLLQEKLSIDDNYAFSLHRSGDRYSFRMVPKGWFGKSWELQRGYGDYSVEGEVEEEMLGPVKHVIFVIHGVGEAQRSGKGISAASSLERAVTEMRVRMQKQQVDEWVKRCDAAIDQELPAPMPPNRVELIPINWYDHLQSNSDSMMKSLKATTLPTIPALRDIANDLMFEVLTYLSPPYCHKVLECVTDRIIEVHRAFKKIHSHYNGGFSLLGHSLGSVICWDLLTILKHKQEESSSSERGVHITTDTYSSNMLSKQLSGVESPDTELLGSWGPSLPRAMERHLPFTPDFTIFFGSPLGLYLTLRGAHPVFDALRETQKGEGKLKVSPFTLPSWSIHNIFHPNDPVAYRIEPLMLSQETDDLPPPVYLTREDKGLRFHVKAMHLGDNIRRSITETQKSISSFVDYNITEPVQRLFGKEPEERPEEEEEPPLRFPLAGERGIGRVDFQLQPPVMDNKLLAVSEAHASYFTDTDILDYLIDLTRDQRPIRTIAKANAGISTKQVDGPHSTSNAEDTARVIAI